MQCKRQGAQAGLVLMQPAHQQRLLLLVALPGSIKDEMHAPDQQVWFCFDIRLHGGSPGDATPRLTPTAPWVTGQGYSSRTTDGRCRTCASFS